MPIQRLHRSAPYNMIVVIQGSFGHQEYNICIGVF